MSNSEMFKEFYSRCKEIDIEETVELVLNAETKEEQEFIELISNFILQSRQKDVITQGKF